MNTYYRITYEVVGSVDGSKTDYIEIWTDSFKKAIEEFVREEIVYGFSKVRYNENAIVNIERMIPRDRSDVKDSLTEVALLVLDEFPEGEVYYQNGLYYFDSHCGGIDKFTTLQKLNTFLEDQYVAYEVEMQYEENGEWYHQWDTNETDLKKIWDQMGERVADERPTEGGRIRIKGKTEYLVVNGGFDED